MLPGYMMRSLDEVLEVFACSPQAAFVRTPLGTYLDSGVPSPSESWQVHSGIIDASALEDAAAVFGDSPRYIPSTSPDAREEEALARSGAAFEGTLYYMTSHVDSAHDAHGPAPFAVGPDRSDEWADACWRGFDSDEDAPHEFHVFADAMSRMDDVILLGAGRADRIEATGMAVFVPSCAAPFYIATAPSARRLGLGRAIMSTISLEASRRGSSELALIATKSGRYLYERVGYSVIDEIKMWRYGDD